MAIGKAHRRDSSGLILRVLITSLIVSLSGCSFGHRFIFSSTKEMVANPAQFGLSYEDVLFQSPDGLTLHGWLVPGDPEKPKVLYFHGNTANISHRIENLAYLHRLGLSVFLFDYRGFGRSEGVPYDEESLYRDARGALDFLREKGWDLRQSFYYGRSMGAAVALQMSLERPPAGVILECSFTSLRKIARHLTPTTYFTVGWWGIGNQFNNLEKIARLRRPVLIIHGDNDPIAPKEMSEELYAYAHPPKYYLLVNGAGHSDAFLVGGNDYLKAWNDFIDATLETESSLKSNLLPKGAEKRSYPKSVGKKSL